MQTTQLIAPPRRQLISVIVPTFNERGYVAGVLDDMLSQQGLDAAVEVLVADGGSTDGTREIVAEYAARRPVRLVHNPQRHQVYGYNRAIREARGDLVCIIHGHARFSPTYLADLLETKLRTGAANVGGVIAHRGESRIGEAIALAMSSPIGVGDSKYRHATREQWCDSVMGVFIERRLFDEIGYYNESNLVNEDCEFNYRLRAAGYRIRLTPKIEVTYYVRSSLRALARQYARYGYYRRWTQVQHPGSVPWRVFAPPLLVLALAASIVAWAFGRGLPAVIVPACYAGVLALAFADGMRRAKRLSVAIVEPVAIATMHLAFGLGWLWGFVTLRRPRTDPACN